MEEVLKSMMNGQEVEVRSEIIAPFVTCPICKKLFKQATSLTECLHSFCKKCIKKKITKEKLDKCPICSKDLGCSPLDKLRPDHMKQELKASVIDAAKREAKKSEAVSSVPLPARRKEKSLSSFVSTPNVPNGSTPTAMTGTKKPVSRKASASRGSSTVPTEKPNPEVEDRPKSSSSPVTPTKIAQYKKLSSLVAESSEKPISNKGKERSDEPLERLGDLLEPLEGITKSSKSNSETSGPKIAPLAVNNDEEHRPKVNENGSKSKVNDNENGSTPSEPGSVKPRKNRGGRKKKEVVTEAVNIPAQKVVDSVSNQCEKRVNPIWLTLVASDDHEGDEPLPQIRAGYLMIKDVNMPVSFIREYIARKLGLDSEAEVEVTLQGQPLLPTLQLHSLMDFWLHTENTSQRIKTTVGSSAKDFVLSLGYHRKAQPS